MSNEIRSIEELLNVAEFELGKSANISSEYEKLRKFILDKAELLKEEGIYDDEFIFNLWVKRTKNGIANTSSNNISKKEFEKAEVKEALISFTNQIAQSNTKKTFDEVVNGFKHLKEQGIIQYIYRASIARVFCTFYPDEHINWVTDDHIKNINLLFSDSFIDIDKVLVSNKKVNWFDISISLRLQINIINDKRSKPLESKLTRQIISLYYRRMIFKEKIFSEIEPAVKHDEHDCIDTPSTKRKKVNLDDISPQNRKTTGRTITVSQNEKELTQRFLIWIEKEKIYELRELEQRTGANDRIDVTLQQGLSLIYAELKSVSSYSNMPKRAIRAALGQILDYQFYDSKETADELWIVLDKGKLTQEDKEFIKSLNLEFKKLNLKLLVEKNNSSFEVYK